MTSRGFSKAAMIFSSSIFICLAASSRASGEEGKGEGWLSITTNPWAEVEVDGQKIGNTPLVDRPMKSGTYHLTLVNADQGINIADMHTKTTPSPESGTPIFNMKILLQVPVEISPTELLEKLNRLGEKLAIDISLKKA